MCSPTGVAERVIDMGFNQFRGVMSPEAVTPGSGCAQPFLFRKVIFLRSPYERESQYVSVPI